MYLLDTDTVIFSLKGDETIRKNLQRRLDNSIKISIVTSMELYYGAYKAQIVTSNLAKIKTLEQSLEIIPIDRNRQKFLVCLKLNWKRRRAVLMISTWRLLVPSPTI